MPQSWIASDKNDEIQWEQLKCIFLYDLRLNYDETKVDDAKQKEPMFFNFDF